ncbi:MAG: hypothetical protein WCI30_08635 [Clostridia bacterium]
MYSGIIVLPILLIIFVALLALQIILSLQKNKWFGLILPLIYLFLAGFISFARMVYTGDILPIILVFLVAAIPAGINFLIYLVCRTKVNEKNKHELEKMNIQDLD